MTGHWIEVGSPFHLRGCPGCPTAEDAPPVDPGVVFPPGTHVVYDTTPIRQWGVDWGAMRDEYLRKLEAGVKDELTFTPFTPPKRRWRKSGSFWGWRIGRLNGFCQWDIRQWYAGLYVSSDGFDLHLPCFSWIVMW